MSGRHECRDVEVIWRDQPLGFLLDSGITYFETPSYTVVVRHVDWKNLPLPSRIKQPDSEPKSLIKYSMAEHSPVSDKPSDGIQLGTPSYFKSIDSEQGTELMADELEGSYVESLDWKRRGSSVMENTKNRLRPFFSHRANNLKLELTWVFDNVLIYCTSIAPETDYVRNLQEKYISSDYDFATRIVHPSCFATELGYQFGKQIDWETDIHADTPGMHVLASHARTRTNLLGEYLIFVDHGSVLYLTEEDMERIMNPQHNSSYERILPFLKRKKYEGQQEYRFVIDVQFNRIFHHADDKDCTFLLKISEKLRDLMSPYGQT